MLLDAPPEFERSARNFGAPVDREVKGEYGFVLAFVKSLAAARVAGESMKDGLADGGLPWLAYPKGTSKKYRNVDINRDSGRAAMKELGFEGVS